MCIVKLLIFVVNLRLSVSERFSERSSTFCSNIGSYYLVFAAHNAH